MQLDKWTAQRTNSCTVLDRVADQAVRDWFNPHNPTRALQSRLTGTAKRSNASSTQFQMAHYLRVCRIRHQITAAGGGDGSSGQHAQGWCAGTPTDNASKCNCGSDAHFETPTDRTKRRGPREENNIDEIMKLYRERNAFAHDPIDWDDTAIKCNMTCLPRFDSFASWFSRWYVLKPRNPHINCTWPTQQIIITLNLDYNKIKFKPYHLVWVLINIFSSKVKLYYSSMWFPENHIDGN